KAAGAASLVDSLNAQPPTSPLRISPKRSQVSPLNFISCNCETGAKSVDEVLTLTPGRCLGRGILIAQVSVVQVLVAQVAADDVAEQVPLVALEAHHLKLLDRVEVGGAGGDLDAGQQRVRREILQTR